MHLVLKTMSFQAAAMGSDAQRVFDETGGTFGRGQSCDWILPDPERYISSTHGRIFFKNGRFFVTDTSTNGLLVEGQDERIGKDNSVPLCDGDVLLLGEFRLQVHLGEEGQSLDNEAAAASAQGYQVSSEPVSLDPMDLVGSTEDVSTATSEDFSHGQTDEFPMIDDHFQVPGVGNDPMVPRAKAPSSVHDQEQILPSKPLDPDSDGFTEENEVIGEDWDRTEFGLEKVTPGEIDKSDSATPPRMPESVSSEGPPSSQADASSLVTDIPNPVPTPLASRKADKEPNEKSEDKSVDHSDLYLAFMHGLGVEETTVPDLAVEEMRSYGSLLRLMISALMDLLYSRTELKSEFRLTRTMLAPRENNPLKFSPNPDEAIRIFFSGSSTGYLGLRESVEGGLEDMKLHQLAMVAGMQAVFDEFASLMNPGRYSAEPEAGVKALLQSLTQKSRSWEQFCAEFERLDRSSATGISGHLSEVFSDGYERRASMHR